MGREVQLTGYTVDGFEGPQDTHSADSRQVDVLKVQRVFDHPMKKGENEGQYRKSSGPGPKVGPPSHSHSLEQ